MMPDAAPIVILFKVWEGFEKKNTQAAPSAVIKNGRVNDRINVVVKFIFFCFISCYSVYGEKKFLPHTRIGTFILQKLCKKSPFKKPAKMALFDAKMQVFCYFWAYFDVVLPSFLLIKKITDKFSWKYVKRCIFACFLKSFFIRCYRMIDDF